MNTQFLHVLNDSFRLWLENKILTNGEAFRNVNSGVLYPIKSNSFPNRGVYSNPYGQFVYDSSISGANIPTGVYVNGSFVPKGISGLVINHEKGQAIFSSPVNGVVTANYASKDFNIYSTSQSDEELLFLNKTTFRPKYNVPITGVPENATYGPLIYLKRDSVYNEPFSLGGEDLTIISYRAIILTDNLYNLDGVGSLLNDTAHSYFLLLNNPPLNRYGDIYEGTRYNYTGKVCENWDNSNLVYINDVEYYRFDSKVETSINKEVYCGFVEFKLEIPRFPRVNSIYPPNNNIMLYHQTISLPTGIYQYDVIFENGSKLINAEIELPNNSSGIYIMNTQNVNPTGFTAIFDLILETGVNLLITTSN